MIWGIRPVLFYIWGLPVDSYSFFVGLGLAVGFVVYFLEAKKQKLLDKNNPYILLGALAGGAIGAKLLDLFVEYKYITPQYWELNNFFYGKTIVGGLIGGAIGVFLIKKYFGIKERRGNLFAPAIAIGVAIGRIGCFFRGCCYGKSTNLPWGVNFGDGILRHPTQIYEAVFMLIMFFVLEFLKTKNPKPGQLFKILMVSYFTFRFFIEFLRAGDIFYLGLTAFQIVCIFAIIYLTRQNIINFIKNFYGKLRSNTTTSSCK